MNFLKTTLLLGLLTGLTLFIGASVGGRTGLFLALGFAAITNLGSYWFSDRIVLAATHAREAAPADYPALHAVVERLAARAGIPKPRVFVVPEAAPNAFATGRNASHAVVAVTSGLLELMAEDEVEGVLAHELGHVLNRDILISSIAATLAGAVMVLASVARFGALFGGGTRQRSGNPLFLLLAALVAPVAATIIRLGVSRSREYGADDAAVRLLGTPLPLARALTALGHASGRIPMRANPALSHLFIVSPLSAREMFSGLFSSHPPLEKRIARLMAQQGRREIPA